MGLAENLRRLRTAKGLTQSQMAAAAGVPLRSYQNYEIYHREPGLVPLARIAQVLDVTVDELIAGILEESSPPPPATRPMGKRK